MADIKQFNKEAIEVLGYEAGQALAAYMCGVLRGFADYFAVPPSEETGGIDVEDAPAPREKTRLEDCRTCWCNTCANIERCIDMDEDGPCDADRPYPCAECVDGIRYMPREGEERCPCSGYTAGAGNYV